MSEPALAAPPTAGLWRVGRATLDRFSYSNPERVDPDIPAGGNRFDSFTGSYGTMYFGTTPEVCFAETVARFRPKPEILAVLDAAGGWDPAWMQPGNIPADWRLRRLKSLVVLPTAAPFIDIAHPDTVSWLNCQTELRASLAQLGIDEIDLGVITGADRRPTRFIAEYLAAHTDDSGRLSWSGIRYISRLGDRWECWAVFEGTQIDEVDRWTIDRDDPDLVSVAARFGLTIH